MKFRFDPWVGKIPWRRNGNPLRYSCLENPMDSWQAPVHRVTHSDTAVEITITTIIVMGKATGKKSL